MSKELMHAFDSNSLVTRNRFVMGAMLRLRADIHTGVPHENSKEYYRQRAGAGLIISEPLHISPSGTCGAGSAAMYDETHVEAWKEVSDAVHQQGGKIFANLVHAGRVSHSNLLVNREQPLAPSDVAARRAPIYQIDQYGTLRRNLADEPRSASIDEIQTVVAEFAQAAQLAMQAGFDGVELDAGHGYLIDQFLRAGSNQRDDAYGGSLEKRQRFAREAILAVGEAVGFGNVGLLVSPEIVCRDMFDGEANQAVAQLVEWASGKELCYLNCALTCLECRDVPPLESTLHLRDIFPGAVILTGNWTFGHCDELIETKRVDLFGFDRMFIANPDLPCRYEKNAPISQVKRATLYGGGAEGFIDYPGLDDTEAA